MLVRALACVPARASQAGERRGPSETLAHRVDVVIAFAHAVIDPSEVPVALFWRLKGACARRGGHGRVPEVVRGEPVLQPASAP